MDNWKIVNWSAPGIMVGDCYMGTRIVPGHTK